MAGRETIRFVDDLQAAADFMGPGAIETPRYQSEILDMVRRRGALGQRMKEEPATGQPSRYFEQTRIVRGTFRDPRGLMFDPGNDPTRRERAFNIKALQGDINFGLFDVEMTRQQGGQFSNLVAKDILDTTEGLLTTSDENLWNGADSDLIISTSNEYMGLLSQINRTFTVTSSVSIIDAVKAEVASMMSNRYFRVRPTAIYLNPIVGDLIDQEERGNQRQIPTTMVKDVSGGLNVNAINSQAGLLPLFPDWALPNGVQGASTSEVNKTDYKIVILSENLIEYHYVVSARPRVFVLGLEGNLATRYTVVMFGAPVAKGKANAAQAQNVTESAMVTYAHSVGTIVR